MIRAVVYSQSSGEILRVVRLPKWALEAQAKSGEAAVESDADEAAEYFPDGVRTSKPQVDAQLSPLSLTAPGISVLTLGESATLVQEGGDRTALEAGEHELAFATAGSYDLRVESPIRLPAAFTVEVT